jgi:hypothetical protein
MTGGDQGCVQHIELSNWSPVRRRGYFTGIRTTLPGEKAVDGPIGAEPFRGSDRQSRTADG